MSVQLKKKLGGAGRRPPSPATSRGSKKTRLSKSLRGHCRGLPHSFKNKFFKRSRKKLHTRTKRKESSRDSPPGRPKGDPKLGGNLDEVLTAINPPLDVIFGLPVSLLSSGKKEGGCLSVSTENERKSATSFLQFSFPSLKSALQPCVCNQNQSRRGKGFHLKQDMGRRHKPKKKKIGEKHGTSRQPYPLILARKL